MMVGVVVGVVAFVVFATATHAFTFHKASLRAALHSKRQQRETTEVLSTAAAPAAAAAAAQAGKGSAVGPAPAAQPAPAAASSAPAPATAPAPPAAEAAQDADMHNRLAKLEAQHDLDKAAEEAKKIIKQAVDSAGLAKEPEKVFVTKKHEKECHHAPIFVGPKNIPAKLTHGVMLLNSKGANAPYYKAIKKDDKLLIDPFILKKIDDSVIKHDQLIMAVHEKALAIGEQQLVPDGALPKEDKREFT